MKIPTVFIENLYTNCRIDLWFVLIILDIIYKIIINIKRIKNKLKIFIKEMLAFRILKSNF